MEAELGASGGLTASETLDLDAEMEAALSAPAADDSAEMVLDAPIGGAEAEATRMILPDDGFGSDEEATRMLLPDEQDSEDFPNIGPPKDDADDVEDLFAELIEG